jgi:hypothetical protein
MSPAGQCSPRMDTNAAEWEMTNLDLAFSISVNDQKPTNRSDPLYPLEAKPRRSC